MASKSGGGSPGSQHGEQPVVRQRKSAVDARSAKENDAPESVPETAIELVPKENKKNKNGFYGSETMFLMILNSIFFTTFLIFLAVVNLIYTATPEDSRYRVGRSTDILVSQKAINNHNELPLVFSERSVITRFAIFSGSRRCGITLGGYVRVFPSSVYELSRQIQLCTELERNQHSEKTPTTFVMLRKFFNTTQGESKMYSKSSFVNKWELKRTLFKLLDAFEKDEGGKWRYYTTQEARNEYCNSDSLTGRKGFVCPMINSLKDTTLENMKSHWIGTSTGLNSVASDPWFTDEEVEYIVHKNVTTQNAKDKNKIEFNTISSVLFNFDRAVIEIERPAPPSLAFLAEYMIRATYVCVTMQTPRFFVQNISYRFHVCFLEIQRLAWMQVDEIAVFNENGFLQTKAMQDAATVVSHLFGSETGERDHAQKDFEDHVQSNMVVGVEDEDADTPGGFYSGLFIGISSKNQGNKTLKYTNAAPILIYRTIADKPRELLMAVSASGNYRAVTGVAETILYWALFGDSREQGRPHQSVFYNPLGDPHYLVENFKDEYFAQYEIELKMLKKITRMEFTNLDERKEDTKFYRKHSQMVQLLKLSDLVPLKKYLALNRGDFRFYHDVKIS